MTVAEFLDSINTKRNKLNVSPLADGKDDTVEQFFKNCVEPHLPSAKTIRGWHELLTRYVNEKREVVFFIRRYSSGDESRRGFYTRYTNQVGYVYCDNTPAHVIYAMAMNNYVPDYDDFYGAVMQRTIPCKWVNSTKEAPFAAFAGHKNVGLGDAGWKLAHIFSVNEDDYSFAYNQEKDRLFPRGDRNEWKIHNDAKYPYNLLYKDISPADRAKMAAHFLRFVHPINYFLVPEVKYDSIGGGGVGELCAVQNLVYLYNNNKYQDVLQDYEKLIMAKANLFTGNMQEIGSMQINIKYGFSLAVSKVSVPGPAGPAPLHPPVTPVVPNPPVLISHVGKQSAAQYVYDNVERVIKYCEQNPDEMDRLLELPGSVANQKPQAKSQVAQGRRTYSEKQLGDGVWGVPFFIRVGDVLNLTNTTANKPRNDSSFNKKLYQYNDKNGRSFDVRVRSQWWDYAQHQNTTEFYSYLKNTIIGATNWTQADQQQYDTWKKSRP
jgi:hypothetical protein